MISLKKLDKDHVKVLFTAIKFEYENFDATIRNDENKIIVSLIQSLKEKFLKLVSQTIYKDNFSVKLELHNAIIVNKALLKFIEITMCDYSRNKARILQMQIGPQL